MILNRSGTLLLADWRAVWRFGVLVSQEKMSCEL
jgi:hypothetical protein